MKTIYIGAIILLSIFALCIFIDYTPDSDKQTVMVVGKVFVPAMSPEGGNRCFDRYDITLQRIRGKPFYFKRYIIQVNLDMDFWRNVKIGDTLKTKY